MADLLMDEATANPEQKQLFQQNAEQVAQKIDTLLGAIKSGETNLATSYVQLGSQLLNIRSNKYWVPLGYKNFGKYVAAVKDKIHIGRTQLYLYISTVEKLLPAVSEDQLNTMGISKAIELQRVVTQTGTTPGQELIDKALDPETTRDDLKGAVYANLNLPTDPRGEYFDFGGCYVTPEEKDELLRGFDVAVKVDPPVPVDWKAHSRQKEIMLRLVREFLGTYEAQVVGGSDGQATSE